MVYVFRFRPDMPPGFIKNDNVPELPAVNHFLQQYEGNPFDSVEEFKAEMEKFPEYLKNKKVPHGSNGKIRDGIFVFDNGIVCTLSDGMAGQCYFGNLEEVVLSSPSAHK